METPWGQARKRLNTQKPKHQRSEIEGARGNGGTLQINSGRTWFSKRDFRKFNFIVENRQTDNKTYSVDARELKKITREAHFEKGLPAMRLDFSTFNEDWVLIRRVDFEDFFQAFKMLEGLLESERENNKGKA